MQAIGFQVLQREVLVTDLKLWWNAETLIFASAAS
jgi:hypothetical protein